MRHVALQLTLLSIIGLAIITGPVLATAPSYNDANVSGYNTDVELESAGGIESAIENGTATPAEAVLIGDSLIVAIDSERLAEEVDEANGSTTTERFFDVLDGDPELLIRQTNPFQKYGPKVFRPGPANTTVYRSGNTTYAVIDTSTVDVDRPDSNRSENAEIDRGDVYQIQFGTDLSMTREEGSEFRTIDVEAEFDDGVFDPLAPDIVNRTVRTYIEPDEELVVTLSLDGGETRSERVVVSGGDSGKRGVDSHVEFDLREVDSGTEYTLRLVHDGTVVDRRNGTVSEPNATLTDARFVEIVGERHLTFTVRLSHGGTVVTETLDGERRAVVDGIAPGESTEVEIPVQEDYLDNPDAKARLVPERGHVRAFRTGGPTVTAYPNATYAIDGEEIRRGTLTPTPTATPTPAASASPTGTTTAGSPDDPDDQPGFGTAITVAALAVAALVLLARRRPNTD